MLNGLGSKLIDRERDLLAPSVFTLAPTIIL